MFALTNLFYIVIISFIWGTSNPFIRKGALHKECNSIKLSKEKENYKILRYAVGGINFILNWRFSIPFLINQLGSVCFKEINLKQKNNKN